ncbi:MAG: acyl-CoA dehydrogenase [Acetobacteraceae bacterium]|nr:acyl-CoA dehydrogenase [Acetobacteraceae bacterium]MSP29951.1 acyl-CoA dehydrogenase [Acetobacteraceae bacterium]
MDLSFSLAETAFQTEVRDFIAAHLTADIKRAWALTSAFLAEPDVAGPWHRALATQGWVAPLWPRENGGPGWTPAQHYIFETECALAGAPPLAPLGIRMVGPVLIGFGSAAQKAHYLPRILSGEDYWCQGYSEPGAGSDLASLSTRAVHDGDDYLVNGSKIWTTHAHHANRMFALVRTGQGERKQEGISFLLIDMTAPGISVRPIRTMGGDHDVNQVFFNDVRVPVANLVGEEGKGWSYGKYLLEFERGAGIAAARMRVSLNRLRAIALGAAGDPLLAARFSEIEIDIDTVEMTELRIMASLQAGQNPGPVASMLWLRTTEVKQAVTRLGVDVLGADALPSEPMRPFHRLNRHAVMDEDALPVIPLHLNGRAETIFGGTSEVQREIIGKLMLGL